MDESERDKWLRLCGEAFEQERFVLVLVDHNNRIPVQFTPKYEEADFFIRAYVAPFVNGLGGTYQNISWQAPFGVSMDSEKRQMVMTRYARWGDISSIEIFTETEEQRTRLNEMIQTISGWRPFGERAE